MAQAVILGGGAVGSVVAGWLSRQRGLDVCRREALPRHVLLRSVAQKKVEARPDGLVRIVSKRAHGDGTVAVDPSQRRRWGQVDLLSSPVRCRSPRR